MILLLARRLSFLSRFLSFFFSLLSSTLKRLPMQSLYSKIEKLNVLWTSLGYPSESEMASRKLQVNKGPSRSRPVTSALPANN